MSLNQNTLLTQTPAVLNIGIDGFNQSITTSGATLSSVAWRPPGNADPVLAWQLARLMGDERIAHDPGLFASDKDVHRTPAMITAPTTATTTAATFAFDPFSPLARLVVVTVFAVLVINAAWSEASGPRPRSFSDALISARRVENSAMASADTPAISKLPSRPSVSSW